ncbi:hypothetical protein AAU57_08855 [Nonlabens sp. YIK11]|uniref:hypothetical protein n=1 Tax=Nonlabens sp. YIK11 TaxID=1453349 RepID=UPI0006DC7DA9|nr:hypothetical protein [Nonlabens sp. YIK11]KQC33412.1 hypothetical protein AAU57_08855 [Nonlabens sp. YIK11]
MTKEEFLRNYKCQFYYNINDDLLQFSLVYAKKSEDFQFGQIHNHLPPLPKSVWQNQLIESDGYTLNNNFIKRYRADSFNALINRLEIDEIDAYEEDLNPFFKDKL